MKGYTVPDVIFPSDNDFGIPNLLIDVVPSVLIEPFEKWGDQARARQMDGTYHFYTEDYKFEGVWRRPDQLVRSGCQAVVEPNFSHGNGQPLVVFLWDLYRRRWLGRFWQEFGIQVWVDLGIAGSFTKYALLGVPRGYPAYATRGLTKDFYLILRDYELAKGHAGREPLFLVYGGGQLIENLCIDKGWIFQPENMHVKDGRLCKRRGLQLAMMEVFYGQR